MKGVIVFVVLLIVIAGAIGLLFYIFQPTVPEQPLSPAIQEQNQDALIELRSKNLKNKLDTTELQVQMHNDQLKQLQESAQ